MKVFINALSIQKGGSLVVSCALLKEMTEIDPSIQWLVALHPSAIESLPKASSITALKFDWAYKSPLHLLYWYNIKLPKLINIFKVDVLFSLTNYLPYFDVNCPTLLLEQHAGHFSDQFCKLMEKKLNSYIKKVNWRAKTKWVYNSVRKANILTLQTNSLAELIINKAQVNPHRIKIIPHGPGLVSNNQGNSIKIRFGI